MRPENICSLLLSAAFIENIEMSDDCEFLFSISDFLKVVEATRHQDVSFGHFQHIISSVFDQVRDVFQHYEELFETKYNIFTNEIREFSQKIEISQESPLGIIFYSNLYELETSPVFASKNIIQKYKEWKEEQGENHLTLLMNPDYAFNKKPLPTILSPLPSYVDPSKVPSDEEFLSIVEKESETPQGLLYLALKHAEQRKTSLAIEEASKLSLIMAKSDDESIRSRAAVILAQIYEILGLKADSVLALNESIDNAKLLPDASILSSAVALKAKIEKSSDMWKHAAMLSDSHPEAKVQSTFSQTQSLSEILKLDYPYIAASIYSKMDKEASPLFAEALPPSLATLPVVIEPLAKEGNWGCAARILKSQDFDRMEVRATALALGSLYYKVYECHDELEEMKTELDEILSIDIGNFNDIKGIIKRIENAYDCPVDKDSLPFNHDTLYGIKWTLENIKSGKEIQENTKNVLDSVVVKEEIDGNLVPLPIIRTIDIEELIEALSSLE